MGNKRLVVWGASGHALVVADIIRQTAEYDIEGFLDDSRSAVIGSEYYGAQILGGREQLELLLCHGVRYLIFGFGNNRARLSLADTVRTMGYQLAVAIHPRAIIASDVLVGPGTVIAAGAVINPRSVIGENVIINTSSSVDHECIIEDGVHIGPGCRLGGGVKVERGAWLGIGATIRDHVTIGGGAVIGAGAVVLHNILPEVIAYGVPARAIRQATILDEIDES